MAFLGQSWTKETLVCSCLLLVFPFLWKKRIKGNQLTSVGYWKKQEKGLGQWKKRSCFYQKLETQETEKENLGVVVQKGRKFLTRTLHLFFECLEEPKQAKKQPIQRKNLALNEAMSGIEMTLKDAPKKRTHIPSRFWKQSRWHLPTPTFF